MREQLKSKGMREGKVIFRGVQDGSGIYVRLCST